jgi:glyoxylase-like metal-dependent hydrolase (beta-lactamase superfamily II)
MGMWKWFAGVAMVGWLLVLGPDGSAQHSRSDNEITTLDEGVYLFRHQFHQAIFISTPEGVIVTDPISSEAATWLKAELKTLTDQPVRYVVYSHHHSDHITGGRVFAGQAIFVSHAAARAQIVDAADPTTPVPHLTFTDRMFIDLGGKHVELIYTG